MSGEAFWVDDEYDREQASDGVSRFGAYMRQAGTITECWDGTWDDAHVRRARFAEAVWTIATTPVMSPGYVRRRPRLLSARVEFNTWDATLAGVAELVTPWPQPLARSRDWPSGSWRDWPVDEAWGGREVYRGPDDDEIAACGYLMASAKLVFPLRCAGLPAAPFGPRDDVLGAARQAVTALVAAMNAAVSPVIAVLERS